MNIRSYRQADYDQLRSLYLEGSTFGGQIDEARDSAERLKKKIDAEPDAILVAEVENKLVGTVSLIDDGRVAWLFRFAVKEDNDEAVGALHDKAIEILKNRGHKQVLVYAPTGNNELDQRYEQLNFNHGNNYTCYWKDI